MTDDYDHARSIAIAERRWLVDARARLRSTRTTRVVRVTRLPAPAVTEPNEGSR
ncbi:MAG: hypothetical protein NTX33_01715 [Propionibacteriales bacterium]|nr:hypothetical protein [Propionibacteriales bacterium]